MTHLPTEIWDIIAMSGLFIDDIINLRGTCTFFRNCFSFEEIKKLIAQRSVTINKFQFDFPQNRRIEYVNVKCRYNEMDRFCSLSEYTEKFLNVLKRQHHIRHLHFTFGFMILCRDTFNDRVRLISSKPNDWPELKTLHLKGNGKINLPFPLQQLRKLELNNIALCRGESVMLPELETLVLRQMRYYNIVFESDFHCPKLKHFDAPEFEGVRHFASPCPLLEIANLASSCANDDNVKELCKSECLEVIDLHRAYITDTVFGNDEVARLRIVNVTDCLDFSPIGVSRLVKAHAKTLRIIYMSEKLYKQTCLEYPLLFRGVIHIEINTHFCFATKEYDWR